MHGPEHDLINLTTPRRREDDDRHASGLARHAAAVALGRALRTARLQRGRSQEEVAHAAGISVYAYGCLERGQSTSGGDANPTLDTLLRVLHALGLELRELSV